jgi:hypothetical protein
MVHLKNETLNEVPYKLTSPHLNDEQDGVK